jgi:hypothetical protein
MAYADPLDQNKPDGADKRKFGDDQIRTHIRAIRQRLASVFVDVDVDPLTLKDNTVVTTKIVDGNVTAAKLADASVSTAKIVDAAVTLAKLAPLSVDTSKLIDAAVTLVKLADGAVSTSKIVDAAVTLAKLDPTALGKFLVRLDGFFVDNAVGTSNSFMERFRTGGTIDQHVTVMPRAGEIRAVWVRGNADRTSGNIQFLVSINGVNSGAFAQIGDAPYGVREDYRLYAAGAVPFAVGDYLGMNWISVGLLPAGSTEYVAGFEVRYT